MSMIDRAKEWKSSAGGEGFCAACKNERYTIESGESYIEAQLCTECMIPCPECSDQGYVIGKAPNGAMMAHPCQTCGDAREHLRRFNEACLPRRYAGATIESWKPGPGGEQAKLRFLELRKQFEVGGRGIGLSGNVGVGKTHLVCALVRELTIGRPVQEQVECRFVEFTHLLSDIRRGYDEGRGEGEIIGELSEVDVLVIDELGKGLSTSWQINILDALISRRYNLDVTTFFTTNFPFGEPQRTLNSREITNEFNRGSLVDKIGERMFSRLSEMCDFIQIEGQDYRRISER